MSTLALASLAVLSLLFSAFAPAAAAQADPASDEAQLLEQESALEARVAEIEAELDALQAEQGTVEADIMLVRGDIERAADELELLALKRREPAIIRASVAIERFVSGDPAREAFAQELQALGGANASQDPLQQQQVFGSVVEAADAELTEVTSEIETVVASIPAKRAARAESEARLGEIGTARETLNAELATAEDDLVSVAAELVWYRDFASRSVLTGRPAQGAVDRPALVVKIDNVGRARPQSGINSADVVYVELVEGGSTRFAAVFHSENVGTIGPIRSMRTTDINLLRGLNRPLFANSGGNLITTRAINSSPLVNVGASTGAGRAYFRSSGRRAPHNLYSTDSALRSASSSAGNAPRLFTVRRPGTPNPNPSRESSGVNVRYRSTSVSYSWNGAGWARSQDGAATVDETGERTAPETVIVRFTSYGTSAADANSPEAITVGTGNAWIFTDGQLIEGTWSKPTADSITAYSDSDGNPVELLPGRVWIEIPLPGGATLR